MREIEFLYSDSLISNNELDQLEKRLQSEIEQMNFAVNRGYDDDRASINLPDDKENLEKVKSYIKNKQELNPKYLIVVGIGGSNLGTIAVQETIFGKLYNQTNPKLKVLYADTVDSDQINDIISIVEPVLKDGDNIIVNCISKSGGTTETIANFEVLVDVLKKYKSDFEKYVVVATDKDSKFWDFAMRKGFDVLEIPKKVGGRYSVFSAVGLFPLGMLGIDIDHLLKGANLMKDKCLNKNLKNNPAALNASLIYQHKLNGITIHDLFLFSSDLESIGKWYRQLMGESIGKEFNKDNKKVLEGITPTVSIGSTDLHSMAQLYLGGPYDKFTTFVRVENNKEVVNIPKNEEYSKLVKGIQGKSLSVVMDAILTGVQRAFKNGKRPFVEIVLPDKSAYTIGQFLQFKEMEMMYLGFLLNVNPFDQPNVELYKIETKKILESERTNSIYLN
jgi:glucose-6-phosphate isomerase